jgi:hypothetical protein
MLQADGRNTFQTRVKLNGRPTQTLTVAKRLRILDDAQARHQFLDGAGLAQVDQYRATHGPAPEHGAFQNTDARDPR